jgi:hypothetical protein
MLRKDKGQKTYRISPSKGFGLKRSHSLTTIGTIKSMSGFYFQDKSEDHLILSE